MRGLGAILLGLTVVAAATAASGVPSVPGPQSSVLVVTGRGWGHGVGMSQWGARGYARHGWSYRQILAHYYPGIRASWARIVVRVGGSWIAAIGVLMLGWSLRPA